MKKIIDKAINKVFFNKKDILFSLIPDIIVKYNLCFDKNIIGIDENALSFVKRWIVDCKPNQDEFEEAFAYAMSFEKTNKITIKSFPSSLTLVSRLEICEEEFEKCRQSKSTIKDMILNYLMYVFKKNDCMIVKTCNDLGIGNKKFHRLMKSYNQRMKKEKMNL